MPRIPEYNINPGGVAVNTPVTQDAGLASAGDRRKAKAFELIDTRLGQLQEKRKKAEDTSFLYNQATESQLLYASEFDRLQRERLNDPEGAAEEFKEFLQSDIERRVGEARTPELATRLEASLSSHLARYGIRAAEWENNRTVDKLAGALDTRNRARMEAAARSDGNRSSLDRIYQEAHADLEEATEYLPAERVAVMRDQLHQKLYGTGVEAGIATNPAVTLSQLKNGDWDNVLNDIQIDKAMRSAESRIQKVSGLEKKQTTRIADDKIYRARVTGEADYAYAEKVGELLGEAAKESYLRDLTYKTHLYNTQEQLKELSRADIMTLLDSSAKELENAPDGEFKPQHKMLQEKQQMALDILEQREKAPVDAALATLPKPTEDISTLLSAQAQLGIPEKERGVMRRAQAAALTEEINTQTNPSQVRDMLLGLQERYGDYLPHAIKDLERAGLKPQYRFAMSLDPIEDAQNQRALLQIAQAKKSELAENVPSEVKLTLEDGIERELEDYYASVMTNPTNAPQDVNMLREEMEKLAIYYSTMGYGEREAAEKSASSITNKFEFRTMRGQPVRIPKRIKGVPVPAAVVEREAKRVLRDVLSHPDSLLNESGLEGNLSPLYLEKLETEAYWVTSNDDDRLILRDHLGNYVMQKKGNGYAPVTVPFTDLLEDKEKLQEAFERSDELQRLQEEEQILMQRF